MGMNIDELTVQDVADIAEFAFENGWTIDNLYVTTDMVEQESFIVMVEDDHGNERRFQLSAIEL